MANYKELEGFSVQTLATDPDSPGWVGSIFYNSTSGTFKTVKPGGIAVGTWSSGDNLNTGRRGAGAFGTQTAAVVFGGEIPAVTNSAESYNGTSWSPINSMTVPAYRTAGLGTQAAGKRVATGPGAFATTVEDFDGTNWTSGTNLTTPRAFYNSAGGTQTASIAVSGFIPTSPFPTGTTANVESWNGSAWTEVGNVSRSRSGAYAGTQTAGVFATGNHYDSAPSATNVNNTEIWNGTSWTEVAEVNTARSALGSSGISTSALIFAGYTTVNVANTEFYDGTSWTEVNDAANALSEVASATGSPSSTSIKIGGSGPSTSTEEWNAPDVVINTLTTS
jgi:hypothetical protein